jgi:GNAT superfamily N-acetyltransferase
MNAEVSHTRLIHFVEIAEKNNIDFAKITYNCGARNFVDITDEVDYGHIDIAIRTYKFKECYTDIRFIEFMPYWILSLYNRSYLMYELHDTITIWVCYTEEEYRGKGYIKQILKSLIEKYPNMDITIDTYNESLCNICKSLGIVLFRG